MKLHQSFRQSHPDGLVTSCRKEECRLQLDVGPKAELTVIDCDRCQGGGIQRGKICDYFVFQSEGRRSSLFVVEMKSGAADMSHALGQLQAGCDWVARLAGSDEVDWCYPLLLTGRGGHAAEIKVLRNRRVTFKGKRLFVVRERCGSSLSQVIERNKMGCRLK